MSSEKPPLSASGILLATLVLIGSTLVAYEAINWLCLLFGPAFTAFACRPVPGSNRWVWHKPERRL